MLFRGPSALPVQFPLFRHEFRHTATSKWAVLETSDKHAEVNIRYSQMRPVYVDGQVQFDGAVCFRCIRTRYDRERSKMNSRSCLRACNPTDRSLQMERNIGLAQETCRAATHDLDSSYHCSQQSKHKCSELCSWNCAGNLESRSLWYKNRDYVLCAMMKRWSLTRATSTVHPSRAAAANIRSCTVAIDTRRRTDGWNNAEVRSSMVRLSVRRRTLVATRSIPAGQTGTVIRWRAKSMNARWWAYRWWSNRKKRIRMLEKTQETTHVLNIDIHYIRYCNWRWRGDRYIWWLRGENVTRDLQKLGRVQFPLTQAVRQMAK